MLVPVLLFLFAISRGSDIVQAEEICSVDLATTCSVCCNGGDESTNNNNVVPPRRYYNCSLPGLQGYFPPTGVYEGVKANYLSFNTDRSSPNIRVRAKEFEACTGGRISFAEAHNIFTDPIADLGTKTSRGSEVYDGYFMSYSHFPEASALGLAETLNDRIREDNDRLKWEDVLPQVKTMGTYRKDGVTNIDLLMLDGDFLLPVIRLDLLEKYDLPLPNTWEEVAEMARFFHGKDLNGDLIPDYGFCHFPRIGAGFWDWWFPETVYSTWGAFAQTHGVSQGFFFDKETMEPKLGEGFRQAVQIWKDLWKHGSNSYSFIDGRCAIGFGPPGEWKALFLNPDGIHRKDTNGTVVWQAKFKNGEYAEPYRFKPFGSLMVEDPSTGELTDCTPDLCPKSEVIPSHGHHGEDNDRLARIGIPPSPYHGRLINRAPFYWSGGLGTIIRKSSPKVKKDMLWDFFVYCNSPDTSVNDVASYNSWLDSWRYSQLLPGDNFIQAGWSYQSYKEHADIMQWALSDKVNGALNIRIPGAVKYTRDVLGNAMREYIDGRIFLDELVELVGNGWTKVTNEEGLLDQLEVYRASLGLDSLSEVALCRLHRPSMDEKDPSVCRQYDPLMGSNNTILVAILIPALAVILLVLGCFIFDQRRKSNALVWQIQKKELLYAEPPEVAGRGTFGLVLIADYRGTRVAVKRVVPPQASYDGTLKNSNGPIQFVDIEAQQRRGSDSTSKNIDTEPEQPCSKLANKASFVGDKSGYLKSSSCSSQQTSNFNYSIKNSHARLKAEFLVEIEQLSKLRHPCITTIMGAVTARGEEPLLVMEFMDHGSLYDMAQNETMEFNGEILLSVFRDIAQGMRFLHSATPQIVHSDLKASNILVDSRFRAKVADFGLSQKRKVGAVGTPYWLAPEVLRGETSNTTESDTYAFGMIIWESYGREDPYVGEDYVQVLQDIADNCRRPFLPPSCPPKAASMMDECMYPDSKQRPTFEELHLQLKRLDSAAFEPLGIDKGNKNKPSTIAEAKKKNDREAMENLLFEVFPRFVAEALRDGRKVEPLSRDIVTVFFSDIVGFTEISSRLTPLKVSDLLGRLYSKFDDLAREHEVYKVETIGDAYMAVTNLVEDQSEDHVKRIAEFAVAAVQAAQETKIDVDDIDEKLGYVNIRVGFHSGPVVANVVGSLNPRFCLFGDVVNTSSRMESTSERNRIQCSERSACLLRDQCPSIKIATRGFIPVKGKGFMLTFWCNEMMNDWDDADSDNEVISA